MLVAGWAMADEQRARVLAAIGHATTFPTWQSLVRESGLTNAQAVALMVCLVTCAAGGRHSRAARAASTDAAC